MRAAENPFRTSRLSQLAFRDGVASEAEARVDRWQALERLGDRGAIVGPHGSGKSTLLRECAARLEERGLGVVRWVWSDRGAPAPLATLVRRARALGPQDALLVDGAGHLSRLGWWRIRRAASRAGVLVVTAHAPGLLPTWVETRMDAPLARQLSEDLLGVDAARIEPLLEGLLREHDGNLHSVFLALYDLAARDDPRLR